ncbi:hypothetical protein PsorP6_001700 [Peronosclerospora sorghi]|uniref:Uncharacterized protein n=1 Tax=Peronosclerospora sorghi TaxID=230839 RepID=A0ACC0WXQ2_9STRA|nr:hypothetical protein PsorP6_001700 [Peronosclerospora sorghi]
MQPACLCSSNKQPGLAPRKVLIRHSKAVTDSTRNVGTVESLCSHVGHRHGGCFPRGKVLARSRNFTAIWSSLCHFLYLTTYKFQMVLQEVRRQKTKIKLILALWASEILSVRIHKTP